MISYSLRRLCFFAETLWFFSFSSNVFLIFLWKQFYNVYFKIFDRYNSNIYFFSVFMSIYCLFSFLLRFSRFLLWYDKLFFCWMLYILSIMLWNSAFYLTPHPTSFSFSRSYLKLCFGVIKGGTPLLLPSVCGSSSPVISLHWHIAREDPLVNTGQEWNADPALCFADVTLAQKVPALHVVPVSLRYMGGHATSGQWLSSDSPVGIPCHHPSGEG